MRDLGVVEAHPVRTRGADHCIDGDTRRVYDLSRQGFTCRYCSEFKPIKSSLKYTKSNQRNSNGEGTGLTVARQLGWRKLTY